MDIFSWASNALQQLSQVSQSIRDHEERITSSLCQFDLNEHSFHGVPSPLPVRAIVNQTKEDFYPKLAVVSTEVGARVTDSGKLRRRKELLQRELQSIERMLHRLEAPLEDVMKIVRR